MNRSRQPAQSASFFTRGCKRIANRYCVIRDKENPRVLHSAGELREMFAPVESAEEALSCAMAAAGSCVSFDGRYGHAAPDEYRNFVKHIEDAHVEAAEGGYAVNLFPQQGCG